MRLALVVWEILLAADTARAFIPPDIACRVARGRTFEPHRSGLSRIQQLVSGPSRHLSVSEQTEGLINEHAVALEGRVEANGMRGQRTPWYEVLRDGRSALTVRAGAEQMCQGRRFTSHLNMRRVQYNRRQHTCNGSWR